MNLKRCSWTKIHSMVHVHNTVDIWQPTLIPNEAHFLLEKCSSTPDYYVHILFLLRYTCRCMRFIARNYSNTLPWYHLRINRLHAFVVSPVWQDYEELRLWALWYSGDCSWSCWVQVSQGFFRPHSLKNPSWLYRIFERTNISISKQHSTSLLFLTPMLSWPTQFVPDFYL